MKKLKATVPVAAQFVGGVSSLAGCYLFLGLPAALVIGGVVVAAWGTMREAGLI